MNVYLTGAYIAWNIVVFLLYGADKLKAKTGTWRIPERTLIMSAVLFGAVGAYAGMKIFHHKTRNARFRKIVPLLVVLNFPIIAFLFLETYMFF